MLTPKVQELEKRCRQTERASARLARVAGARVFEIRGHSRPGRSSKSHQVWAEARKAANPLFPGPEAVRRARESFSPPTSAVRRARESFSSLANAVRKARESFSPRA